MQSLRFDLTEKLRCIRFLILDINRTPVPEKRQNRQPEERDIQNSISRDGHGVRTLQEMGVKIAVISTKNSDAVKNWASGLGIELIYGGISEKKPIYEELKNRFGVSEREIAVIIVDTFPDFPLMESVGFSAATSTSDLEVKSRAYYVTYGKDGDEAVREVAELILKAQNNHRS